MQEPFLVEPDATIPQERQLKLQVLQPARVKAELEAQAARLLDHDQRCLKREGLCPAPEATARWQDLAPPESLAFLEKASGWSRGADHFLVRMPGTNPALRVMDAEP